MHITYGNQTVEFYTKIKSLVEKSPYKENCLKDIDFDEKFIPKRVVVSLSGGCDSAAATYLTLKHFPQIEIYPYCCNDVNAPKDAVAATAIVEYLQMRFPDGKLNDITIGDFNDREVGGYWPKAKELIASDDAYSTMSVVQVAKVMQLDKLIPNFMKTIDRPIRLDGMSKNPPKAVRMAFGDAMKARFPSNNYTATDIDRVQGEARRDVNDKPELRYNVYQPWLNVNKKFVAGVFREEGLMKDLFPITRSCVGSARQTRDFNAWCWQCFWCYEKAWAFNLPRTHNA